MDNAISEYQRWKQQGETLRTQARQAMELRFRELLSEAARISQEYQADFGSVLKPPPQITAFRFKSGPAKSAAKSKKAAAPAPAQAAAAKKTVPAAPHTGKLLALEKKLAQVRAKLDAAKAAGKPTRNFDDKIYEIEDEIRLASQQG